MRVLTPFALMLVLSACEPLLQTDFNLLDDDDLAIGPVDLPGPPSGDRIVITPSTPLPFMSDQTGEPRLIISRDVLISPSPNHGRVYFDPLPPDPARSIYFTWTGELILVDNGSAPPQVAAKLQDLVGPDQPNLFSKFTLRLATGSITVQPAGGIETTVGFGVTGVYTVILRIDPDGRYAVSVTGDGVSPNGGFSHDGVLGANAEIDPSNIGLTLTFDDEVAGGGGDIYRVSSVQITQREP